MPCCRRYLPMLVDPPIARWPGAILPAMPGEARHQGPPVRQPPKQHRSGQGSTLYTRDGPGPTRPPQHSPPQSPPAPCQRRLRATCSRLLDDLQIVHEDFELKLPQVLAVDQPIIFEVGRPVPNLPVTLSRMMMTRNFPPVRARPSRAHLPPAPRTRSLRPHPSGSAPGTTTARGPPRPSPPGSR